MNRRSLAVLDRWHATILIVLAAALWLWPFFWSGWRGQPYSFLPKGVTHQYNAAGLFTKRTNVWWDHHLEIEFLDGTRQELDKRSFFPMGAFGYRTRMDRILNDTFRLELREEIHDEIARFVANRIASGEIAGVRGGSTARILLVRSLWPVGDPTLAKPDGHWNPPASPTLSPSNRRVLGSWTYDDIAVGRRSGQKERPSP